jgi:hypothetical protein
MAPWTEGNEARAPERRPERPESGPPPGTGPEPEAAEEEPGFEDEPPGAVLLAMRPRAALVVWGALDLLLAAALGAVALWVPAHRLGSAQFPLGLLWLFLPISALLGLLVTGFIWLNLPLGSGPHTRARWGFALQLLALAAWVLLSFGVGAGF